MEIPTKVFSVPARSAGSLLCGALLEDCNLAQAARVNLHLVHVDSSLQGFVESFLLDRREPMPMWRPGDRLALPLLARPRMMIFQNVGELTLDEQRRLLAWIEGRGRSTQIISTTPTSLLPRVDDGTFLDTLYYRLNVVCVDLSARYES